MMDTDRNRIVVDEQYCHDVITQSLLNGTNAGDNKTNGSIVKPFPTANECAIDARMMMCGPGCCENLASAKWQVVHERDHL
jgi:hypothetical protein